MKNLKKEITKKLDKNLKNNLDDLKKITSVSEISENYFFDRLLTKKKKDTQDLSIMKGWISYKLNKKHGDDLKKEFEKIDRISQAAKLEKIIITVEWKKNRTWGNCPQAEIECSTEGPRRDVFIANRAMGCGYDKESQTVAEGLNMADSVLRELYEFKNKPKNLKGKNRDVIGYGSGYGILPQFEGGVGVSCFPKIFEKIGFEMSTMSGKTWDVYTVVRSKKSRKKSN